MKNKDNASTIVQRVWQYAHVLKDDGLAFMDYTEQITFLLFLKLAFDGGLDPQKDNIPAQYTWGALKKIENFQEKLDHYHEGLMRLSERPGLIGLIFAKPQSKINDPAKLDLLMRMIDSENWNDLDVDIKGQVYEGLLARNADDVRGGAGQYFTPRPVIEAVVEVMRPSFHETISDPACGTGGFLLGAYDYLKAKMTGCDDHEFLHSKALRGNDLVPNVARLCAMNMFLRGVYGDGSQALVTIGDSLENPPSKVDIVLTNPPFGRKSSFTIVGRDGKKIKDKISYQRSDFWATTSNKQLNFVQHIYSMLTKNGRAAVVVPDNVLFEGGAGETIRRSLLDACEVHTILRLPTGIWYSPGVQANVLFFDKAGKGKRPATKEVWVYDLRSHQNFSLRQNPIRPDHLRDFVSTFSAADRSKRVETSVFRRFPFSAIEKQEKFSLDLQWHNITRQEAEESAQSLFSGILDDLREAIDEFSAVKDTLEH